MADQREDLERLREVLWAALDGADVAVKAQIAGQLRAVVKELAALGGTSEVSVADEIAARRAARQSAAANPASSTGRGQPRRRGGRNTAS